MISNNVYERADGQTQAAVNQKCELIPGKPPAWEKSRAQFPCHVACEHFWLGLLSLQVCVDPVGWYGPVQLIWSSYGLSLNGPKANRKYQGIWLLRTSIDRVSGHVVSMSGCIGPKLIMSTSAHYLFKGGYVFTRVCMLVCNIGQGGLSLNYGADYNTIWWGKLSNWGECN